VDDPELGQVRLTFLIGPCRGPCSGGRDEMDSGDVAIVLHLAGSSFSKIVGKSIWIVLISDTCRIRVHACRSFSCRAISARTSCSS
jgi:hypothetical protein